MFTIKSASWLVGLSLLYHHALALESEIFHISTEAKIQTSEVKSEDHYLFPSTLEYTVTTLRERFSLHLRKSDMEIQPIRTTQGGSSKILIVQRESFSTREVAIYTDIEMKTVVSLNCDSTLNTCHLTGSICKEDRRWMITPVKGKINSYNAIRQDDVPYDITDAIRDGHQWQIDGEPPIEQGRAHKNDRNQYNDKRPRLDIHALDRHRRSVQTSCNIYEAYAISDATVWQYFLGRNSQNASLASADIRHHYEALFREVDVIFSCLPKPFCLRVDLIDVLIQTNSATDWTTLTGSGNVDGLPGLTACANLLPNGPEAAFCFTRNQLQLINRVEGIDAILNADVACTSGTEKSSLFEDLHNGLPRLVAFVIALQLEFDLINCTNNTFNVDDLNITVPTDEADFPATYMFSQCAQGLLMAAIQRLNNENNNCLAVGNLTDDQFNIQVNQSLLAGEVVPLDHQCQLTYGPNSESCMQINTTTNMAIETTGLCGSGVFCRVNGMCQNKTIVYSGTTCDTNKICFKGTCSDDFDCGLPPIVPGGYYILSSGTTRVNGKATLTCFDGYETNAVVTITCRSNGWGGGSENCTLRDCGSPPKVANGSYVNDGDNLVGAVATLKCNANYTANSSHTCLSCGTDGNWSEPQAECILDCGPRLPPTPNGFYKIVTPFTTIGAVAVLCCYDGFNTSKPIQIVCDDPVVLPNETCQPVDCGNPPKVANGSYVNDGDNLVGAVATLKCNANYTANSSHTCLSCGTDGNWSEPQAECILDCGPRLPPTPNGFYKIVTPFTTIGAVAVLCCYDGFNTSKPIQIVCDDPVVLPNESCQPVECDLPVIENGMYVPMTNNTFGNLAILQCNSNFAPSTTMTAIVCRANGTYSPQMAECIPDCGNPPDTENGFYQLDSDSTLLNSTAKLICCNGTFTRNNSRITCGVNGWMGVSNCSADPCPTSNWVREGFSCYLFNTTNRFFNQSRDFCLETNGSTLVQIDNLAENNYLDFYVTNISRPEPMTGFWIGAVQDGPNGTLKWQSGEEVTFNAWGPNQPDDRNFNGTITQQSCTMLWRLFDYHWADIECDVGVPGEPDMRMGFALCEFPLDPHVV